MSSQRGGRSLYANGFSIGDMVGSLHTKEFSIGEGVESPYTSVFCIEEEVGHHTPVASPLKRGGVTVYQ